MGPSSWAESQQFGPDPSMDKDTWEVKSPRLVKANRYKFRLENTLDGFPSNALQMVLAFYALDGRGFAAQPLINPEWVYLPSEKGVIASIALKGDFYASGGVAIRAALEQDGVVYWSRDNVVVEPNDVGKPTQVVLQSLKVDDFSDLETGNLLPNFSQTGQPISLGFVIRRGEAGKGAREFTIIADNVSIECTSN